jgi:ABC-2 type transport system permease protein
VTFLRFTFYEPWFFSEIIMKILDIAFKDLAQSFRSVFAIGMMFVVPLLITGLIYFAFGGLSAGVGRYNLPPLRLAIVNLDQPHQDVFQVGKTIPEFMRDPAMPDWLKVSELPDEASARAALENREIDVALIAPKNLSDAAMSPTERATITILHDPTLTIGPAFVQDVMGLFLDGITSGKIALDVVNTEVATTGKKLEPAAQAAMFQEYSTWYIEMQRNLRHSTDPLLAVQAPAASADQTQRDPLADMMGKIMAGMMIMFVFFTGANTAQTILREDEEGTLARLFTTPTSRSTVLAGKFASVFVTIAVQVIVLMIVSALLFKINWGQPVAIFCAAFGLLIAAAGFGVMVVSFINTARQAGPIIGGVLSATGMLGGLFTTGVAMPPAFETMNLALPQGWALRGLKLALDGAGIADALVPMLVMGAMGAVFFVIGTINFRKRFA